MFLITLSPMRRDDMLTVSVAGDVLVLNGEALDLGTYTADPDAPHDWIVGQPVQDTGVWNVTLILPHGADAPEATRFPQPIAVTADGPVQLPPNDDWEI
ncbi:hypothetical protein [Sinirhodobacter huangdaonensis]|uniref:Uncharacterized protein n=1 Tax=Paenirhodobacter huangdaonensis TaxID=2501515 RepID=A0A3S3PIH7_9RHOB|nr:hypothetical protein [Sinirhodobacter huangdaonensis]RWR54876.1 hypothetical protein EOW66_02080 [Sinirhodobacter huangdaonensis]